MSEPNLPAERSFGARVAARVAAALPDLRHDSEFWRRAARVGAVHGPDAFVRYSPPVFGLAFAAALPHVRRNVAKNLTRAGARATPLAIAQVFTKYAMSLTEAFAVGSGRNERLAAKIIGDSHYHAARAEGRGVIVATAHTSGWYAAGPILGSVYDDDVVVVMQAERDRAAQDVQAQARRDLGLRVLTLGNDPLAAVPLLSHLRKGGILALQMDRVVSGQRGVEVELFGEPFDVPEGPLALAGLSGAPIIVVLGRRVGYLRYEVEVAPPVRVPRKPSREALVAAASSVARSIEGFVARHPTDWYHFGLDARARDI